MLDQHQVPTYDGTRTACPPAKALVRLAKIIGANKVNVAAAHNKRVNAEHELDPSSGGIECLWGPDNPGDVADLARRLMLEAGIVKVRKDAVRAIEVVVSLAAAGGIDERGFFEVCMRWFAKRFGGIDNLLSADIHRDESQPHMHLLIVPIENGKMHGSAMFGGPGKLRSHLSDFAEQVCKPMGVDPPALALRGPAKLKLSQAVVRDLRLKKHPVVGSEIWVPISDCIKRSPQAFAEALGISISGAARTRREKTFVQIMTGRGKGPKFRPGEQ